MVTIKNVIKNFNEAISFRNQSSRIQHPSIDSERNIASGVTNDFDNPSSTCHHSRTKHSKNKFIENYA